MVAVASKTIHLQLAFGCEEGGSGGSHVETVHLWLTFGCEGGGGDGSLGIMGVSGRLRKKEWEKTGNDKCFHDALLGPPTSWVPPHVSLSLTPLLID